MEGIQFFALNYKGGLLEMSEDEAGQFPSELIKTWSLRHDPYTAAVALAVGKRMAEERIGPAFGTDDETIAIAKGQYVAEKIVKEWDRTIDGGTALPVTAENIGTLPMFVLKKLPGRVSGGVYATAKEIEALKVSGPTSPSTPSTAVDEG